MYMIDLIRIICKKMIDLNSNILMIDLSYYIFYRFYALCNWVKLSKTECEMKMEDVFFRKKYEKCFIENINKLKKMYGIEKDTNVFYACDCPQNQIWRKNIFEGYKKGREVSNLFDPNVFTYTYDTIIPKLCVDKPENVLSCDKAEADDIIAVLTKQFSKTIGDNSKIFIITNDNDYLQLLYNNNIQIYNLQKKNLRSRCIVNNNKHIFNIDVYFKILTGDKSDNIKGILSNKKTKELLFRTFDTYNNFIQSIEEEVTKMNKYNDYMLNKKLIDFDEIPVDIKESILNLIQ